MLVPCQLIRGDCLYQIHTLADEIFFIVRENALYGRSMALRIRVDDTARPLRSRSVLLPG